MPIDALPPHVQANLLPEGDGTDHDNVAQRHFNRAWTAFGPRVRAEDQRWTWARINIPFTRIGVPVLPLLAKWRAYPLLLFGYNNTRWISNEDLSFEEGNNKDQSEIVRYVVGFKGWNFLKRNICFGPSPIQKFEKFSFQLTWPLHFAIVYRFDKPISLFGWKLEQFFFRVGARWDSLDFFFVCPALFIGFNDN